MITPRPPPLAILRAAPLARHAAKIVDADQQPCIMEGKRAPSHPTDTRRQISMTITLPPELKQAIEEQAQRQGTTPELLVLDGLRGLFMPASTPASPGEGLTMADFFTGY